MNCRMTNRSLSMQSRRAGPSCSRSDVWTDRTVAWYERANARSDYAATVLSAIEPLVVVSRSAVDVGAGFGALALPLARRLERVTAIEPAPAMVAALRRVVRAERLLNVDVVESRWGETAVGPHDLLVCAHVGSLLRRGSSLLAKASRLARRGVVLVRDAPGGNDKFFYPELYPILLERPYGPCCADDETLEALAELGITPTVTWVEYDSDQPFDSLDEACDFWMAHLGLADASARPFLHEFLACRLRRDGEGWLAPYRKRATVMHWRT